ncbi:hypothetical protein Voc01_053790 [Virgisporangium ochraceum]|uniref:GGDEF domain-containing protein n=1 Tax=Virgisporangium ochraceum TaxID=65505 RepID=A0A8J3ZWY9_9ACTN|nr:GGDEF domain-containing protein [Virgisporangium ochraceum]GIJ70462.1 hypothetical protein Voc01_053790 [Virgisporangium ochraceum]
MTPGDRTTSVPLRLCGAALVAGLLWFAVNLLVPLGPIVMVASAVFIWHFATRPALVSSNRTTQIASLVATTWVGGGDHVERRLIVAVAVGLTAMVILRQVTVLRDNGRLLTQLDHSATHDALTGLPNRVLFHRRLAAALNRPGPHRVSVALADLDDFKEVNDTLGHEVGDLLLTAVAGRFVRCLGGSTRSPGSAATSSSSWSTAPTRSPPTPWPTA